MTIFLGFSISGGIFQIKHNRNSDFSLLQYFEHPRVGSILAQAFSDKNHPYAACSLLRYTSPNDFSVLKSLFDFLYSNHIPVFTLRRLPDLIPL